jgi:hypothetical protein
MGIMESLVSDIPAGDGKIANFILQCIDGKGIFNGKSSQNSK